MIVSKVISKVSKKPALVFVFSFLLYLSGLWLFSIPLTGDQKVYLSVALEMFEKKEWLIPSLFGEPNFLKPPFQYWMTLFGWKTFGYHLFGALLPSVVALFLSGILVYQTAKKIKLANPLAAGIFFMASLGSMTYGTTAQMEIWVVLFYLLSWYAALHSQWGIAFLSAGVSAWVKGPLYPVLWTFGLISWKPRLIKENKFWIFLGLGVLLGLSWFMVAYHNHGQAMMNQFFKTENLGKWNTHQGSMAGLWMEFLLSLCPWVFLLFAGFFIRQTRKTWKKNLKFYLSFGLIPLIFFSLFPYRVNSYLYLLTPCAAWLVSEVRISDSKSILKVVLGIYTSLFLILTVFLWRLNQGDWIQSGILIAFLLNFVLFLMASRKNEILFIALSSLLMVNTIRIAGIDLGEKDVQGLRNAGAGHTPVAYAFESKDIWNEFGLLSAVVGQPIQLLDDESKRIEFMARGGMVIYPDQLTISNEKGIQCREWPRLQKRIKFPMKKLVFEGLRMSDPEFNRVFHLCTVRQ